MIVYNYYGKCVEIKRDSFYTDSEYYRAILNIKYGKSLENETMTVGELCDMI